MGNALEQLRKETRDDARLYGCIRELYEQGVPFEELKAVIPDIRRTREQLHMKYNRLQLRVPWVITSFLINMLNRHRHFRLLLS